MRTLEKTLEVNKIMFGEHITLMRSPWPGHEEDFRIERTDPISKDLDSVIEGTMHQVQITFESWTGVFIPLWCFDQLK